MEYQDFIASKSFLNENIGFDPSSISQKLFDFQRDIVDWACRRGSVAIFADCGMGKTAMQLQWAHNVPGRVLIAAPLAVASQTVREGAKFDVGVQQCRKQDDVKERIIITNYETMHHFDPSKFDAIILDESSILKSYTGKFRNYVIDEWGKKKHKLA